MKCKIIFEDSIPYKFRSAIWEGKESKKKKLHFNLKTKVGKDSYHFKNPVPMWCLRFVK